MAKSFTNLTSVATGDVLTATNFNNLQTTVNSHTIPPACRLQGQSGQSLSNSTTTTLIWPDANEVYDTDGMHGAVNPERITPTTAGIYLLTASIYLSGNTTTRFFLNILKNGTTAETVDIAGAGIGLTATTVQTANGSTDYFTVLAYQTSGGALTVNNSYTFFTATFMGKTS